MVRVHSPDERRYEQFALRRRCIAAQNVGGVVSRRETLSQTVGITWERESVALEVLPERVSEGAGPELTQRLVEATAGEIAAATACMMRKNAETFPGLDLHGFDADLVAPFLPYRDGRADPGLVERYEALGELGPGTFGHAFWEHFKSNRFAFPGDP